MQKKKLKITLKMKKKKKINLIKQKKRLMNFSFNLMEKDLNGKILD